MFIPLTIIGIIINIVIGCLGEHNLEDNQSQVTQSMAQIVEYHLDHGGRILEAIARVAETSETKNLSSFMKSTWEAYGYFETIYCLDKNDKITLMMPSDSRYTGLDLSNLPDLKKNSIEKKLIISHPFISLRTGEPTVYLVRPLLDGGTVIGELNLALFQQEIKNISNKSNKNFVFIMDQTGTLLAHPFSDLVKQQSNFSNLGIFKNTLMGKSTSFYIYNGSSVIGSSTRVKMTGWIVVDQIPLSVFFSSYIFLEVITLLAFIVIGVTLVLSMNKQLKRYVIKPLDYLSKETNALAVGDFIQVNSLSCIPASFVELNKLSEDFKLMSSNLQARETALSESEKRYRGLYDRVPIGLFRVTNTGEILDANLKAVSILGYSKSEELMKVNANYLLYKALTYTEKDKSVLADIWDMSNFQTQLRRYDGTAIWVHINSNIVYDNEGRYKYLEGSMEDITERKHIENKVKEQQELLFKSEKEKREALEKALVMKDEFISLISHEFKTPLNVIYSAIQLIECVYSNQISDRVKELIENIKQNTFRQLRLTNNLLDITRLNSGQFKLHMKNVDIVFLTKMIVESVEVYANQKNIKIHFKSNLNSKIISIDDEKYERIILNIISNSIKFTESGGKIIVILSENKKLNLMQIKIIDTGIGIPKDKQELIFERFGQVDSNLSRQAEGTGIGLALVKLLVDALEGSIELESELNVGSTFIIRLPEKKEIIDSETQPFLDVDNRLINEIKVEFSDIYLYR
ncbi:PAS domain S-box protein [Clostridium sp. PL3]|uniref:histidine kinase n=2 Tax=Clostridium thailandense TaxID=2794346 RepID=A0A949WTI7_9CLOT|nr:PAS domain S-box protein [Clostridium thailandense]